jgi:Secretion system C-terminal sorting domain
LTSRAPYTQPQTYVVSKADRVNYAERGVWGSSDEGPFLNGVKSRVSGVTTATATSSAVFRFPSIKPGRYQVAAWWSVAPERAVNAPFTVFARATVATVRLNQADPQTSAKWNIVGEFVLNAGDSVVVTNQASSPNVPLMSANVCVDAIRLVDVVSAMTSVAQSSTQEEGSEPLSAAFAANAIAPNPATESTTISFSLERQQRVSLSIVDALGRVVTRLYENAFLQTGKHSVVWATSVAAGVYMAILETPSGKQMQRILVLKP